ncbi:MAG: DNA-methyltransferase [Fusobacterium sp.]
MINLIQGSALEVLKGLDSKSINCVVTSPPYWRLRDYGSDQQIGLEETPEEFIANLCDTFDEVYRILKDNGTLFVNLGDSYSGNNAISTKSRRGFVKGIKDQMLKKNNCVAKRKSLVGIPAMFQLEMIKRGWILRNKIIWQKSNVMPESVNDRFTNDYEEVFFFTKNQKYYFNKLYEPYSKKTLHSFKDGKIPNSHKYLEAGKSKTGMRDGREWLAVVSEKGRNMRTVWKIGTVGIKEAHFSTFPLELARRCVEAGCPKDGTVLDLFMGSGTTNIASAKLGIKSIGIELMEDNIEIAKKRIAREV